MSEIRVDRARCQGHALCYATDPDLFPIDDNGFSALTVKSVADTDRATALRGVAACPEKAIDVID